MALDKAKLQEFARRERGGFEDVLRRFVEVPSVSADPERKRDIEGMAELGAETIRRFGGKAELFRVEGGTPVVLGSFEAGPGLPTVTIYNHLDVQPANREAEGWKSEPFVFTRNGDSYHGRGTTDDKGPAVTALFGARAAREAGVPVNVRFLWETEEEVGSPHFDATLKKIGGGAAAEVVVVSDTEWLSRDRPALSAGLRGLVRLIFKLETSGKDTHSGTGGGAARNPLAELAQLSSEICDARTGRIKIPGFYQDVAPLSRREKNDFLKSGFSVKKFMHDHQLKSLRTRDPLQVMTRIWAQPTFEVHGLVGGYTGPGVKTVIPPRAELKATVRMVPNMKGDRVAKLVKAWTKKHWPDVQVDVSSAAPAYRAVTTGPYAEAATRAIKFAFGKAPIFVREGGTIGAVVSMEQQLKAPVVFMGLSLPEHGYHAPNENYDWGQAGGGMVAFAKLLEEVSAIPRPAARVRR
jgi:acetylornithine deacetylase/succinyl-diaminopimelate desuccinylase-like protein